MSTITVTIITAIITSAVTLILQKSFTNVISGVSFVISKPLKKGDRVRIRNGIHELASGTVEKVGMTRTRIRTYDGDLCFIANSVIDGCVIENNAIVGATNWPESIRISLDSDVERAREIIADVLIDNPSTFNDRDNTDIIVRYTEGAIRIQYNVRSCDVDRSFEVCSDLCREIIVKLREEEGIELV